MASSTQTSQNIKRSVHAAVESVKATWGAPVLYTSLPLEKLPKDGAWIDLKWGKRHTQAMPGGEKRVVWVLFFDVWARVKDDELGGLVDGIADKVLEFARDVHVELNDYTEPTAPVSTGLKVRLGITGDDDLEITDLLRGRSITVEVVYFERT